MRINNSRSSEIFDIFSDTMQKFNQKRSDLMIKEADRIGGAVDAGQTISKWLGAGSDIKAELNTLRAGSHVGSFTDISGATIRGIEGVFDGIASTTVGGKTITTMDDILDFVKGGGRIPATKLRKIVSPQMAMDLFARSPSRNRKLFHQAMQTAMNADGSTPLLTPNEISRIYQRMTIQAMANGGKIDPKQFPDVLKGLSREKIIGLTQNWDDLMSGRATARTTARAERAAADAARIDPADAARIDPADAARIDPAVRQE